MSLEARIFEQIFKEVEELDSDTLIKILRMLDYRREKIAVKKDIMKLKIYLH
ncbi:MAG: hypothetical protein ACLTDP_13200 [Terrisporobacter sp.]